MIVCGGKNDLGSGKFIFFILFFNNTKYFTHIERVEKVLRKLTVVYVQKGVTPGYTQFGIGQSFAIILVVS